MPKGKKKKRPPLPPRTPFTVTGGIRAQNSRNLKARVWWGRRWLETLERFALGSRLGRGRSYAASGQVRTLDISAGHVRAIIQGAEPEPYRTELRLRTLNADAVAAFRRALQDNPVWSARLAIRDFPAEFEPLFDRLGCPLFPAPENDLVLHCTCRDWVKPCKHLAALFYLLAEAIERDPQLLLTMRGVPRELTAPSRASGAPAHPAVQQHPRMLSAADFWGEHNEPFSDYGTPPAGTVTPLVRRLGSLPFWRGTERLVETLNTVYARGTTLGLSVLSGEKINFKPRPPDTSHPFTPIRSRFRIDTTM